MKDELFAQKGQLYCEALTYWKLSLYINFGTLHLLLFSVFWSWAPLAWLFGLISLAAPMALVICREMFSAKFRAADRCKRLLHFSDSLGIEVPQVEAACILGHKHKPRVPDTTYTDPYYASINEQGPRRLVDNTRESAFFTFKLAGISKWWTLGIIIAMGAIVAVIFHEIITVPVGSQHIQNFAKSAAAIVSFLFTGDIVVIFIRYLQLEKEAEVVYRTLDEMLKRDRIGLDEAMRAVEEYDIAVIQGPPILPTLHRWNQENLNEAYRTAHGLGRN